MTQSYVTLISSSIIKSDLTFKIQRSQKNMDYHKKFILQQKKLGLSQQKFGLPNKKIWTFL